MRLFGVDFTSAPRRAKPITVAACTLDGHRLYVDAFAEFDCLEVFENFLGQDGPWVAAMDFPFGQPAKLVEALSWPRRWSGYVGRAEALGMRGFEAAIREYRDARPSGDKHHLRRTDELAGSRSPMMLHGVPVGRMFLRGAPCLARSGARVLPFRSAVPDNGRTVLEGYPALVARKAIGRRSYKFDGRNDARAAERMAARRDLLAGVRSTRLAGIYGIELALSGAMAEDLIGECSADKLDAMLCALQAAWAWQRRDANFGIPADVDRDEGWIVDPETGD